MLNSSILDHDSSIEYSVLVSTELCLAGKNLNIVYHKNLFLALLCTININVLPLNFKTLDAILFADYKNLAAVRIQAVEVEPEL